ncbi:MAG TPA: hypothetical protein VK684_09040 [Edaphobacter sp.]|nr:hypothetical protein [Edaphobacter sp.]
MRDEKTYTAAIDVVDARDEKDERKDPPAQAGYGTRGLRQASMLDRIPFGLGAKRTFIPG